MVRNSVLGQTKTPIFLRYYFLYNYLKTSDIYLRAGEWDLQQSLEVARRYSDLGVHYKKYVEVAVPSK